jgi:hypothetical protein
MTAAADGPSRSERIAGAGLASALTSPFMVILLWLGVTFHLVMILYQLPARTNQFDFSIYYASGLALRAHIDPYTTDLDRFDRALNLEIDPIHYATDPPTFLLCFEPFTLLPLKTAFWLWTCLNATALLAALGSLVKGSGLNPRTTLSMIAIALLYPPVGEHFFYGQNKMFILLIFVLMIRWMTKGWDAAAGLILGFAVLLRGFPLVLMGYLVLRRRWRTLEYAVIGIIAGAILTFALLGTEQTLSFSTGFRFVTKARFLAVPINVSLGAFISRMYWYAFGAQGGPSNVIRSIVVGLAQIAVLERTAYATVKFRDREDSDWRAFSLWVVTAVILSPTAWVHYMVLVLIPLLLMVIAASQGRVNERAIWMASASYLLIALSTSGRTAFGPTAHGVVLILFAECSFVSLAMMYLATYWFASDEVATSALGARISRYSIEGP